VLCARSWPSTKRFIRSPASGAGIIAPESPRSQRFHTARVKNCLRARMSPYAGSGQGPCSLAEPRHSARTRRHERRAVPVRLVTSLHQCNSGGDYRDRDCNSVPVGLTIETMAARRPGKPLFTLPRSERCVAAANFRVGWVEPLVTLTASRGFGCTSGQHCTVQEVHGAEYHHTRVPAKRPGPAAAFGAHLGDCLHSNFGVGGVGEEAVRPSREIDWAGLLMSAP
jgi:hypothetical protein